MDRPIIDILWVLVCAALVFLMQAGFLCLETGLTRSKNNINVAIKNLADFGLTAILFWAFGYAFMFGLTKSGWLGSTGFLLNLSQEGAWVAVFFLFEVMFCGTAVTILSGATAERVRFSGYLITAALVSGLIYPLFGHWVWNSSDIGSSTGWLGARGFVDFAGSSVVHSVGGWAALAVLIIIGPRTGRFSKDGAPQYIPGANIPLASLGVLLLWLGWFGFNGGSTLAMNDQVSKIIANTVLAGSSGLVAALALGWTIRKRADVPFAINGSLAGLVAVTANVHVVSSLSAMIIGGIGGIVMVGVSKLLQHFRIDDAVDAVPVHLGAGIWGTLAVALFGKSEFLGTNLTRGEQLGVQFLGIFVCFVWSFGATYLILRIINRFSPFRVTQEDEHIGLNVSEHGASTELVELFTVMDQQLRTQDMSLRAPEEPFTEVGQIAAQYNRVMEALEKVTARIKAIVTTAMDGIITFSKEGLLITTLNPAAETIFGYRETQIRNRPITLLIGPTEDGSPESEPRLIDSILSGTVAAGEYREMIGRRADGSTFLMEGVVTEAKESKETFYTATFRDITERKKQEELIRHMAYHDSLTGLPNRITFYDRLLVAIANAKRDKHIFAVIFIDLDRFKEINDTLGHETGDKVLQTVPRKMKEYLRESDTLSRMGGDEFMLLLPKIKTREDAQAVTEKFLEAFQKPLNINGHEITIGLSIGTSFYPQDGEEPDILVKKADTAMYQAKQSNKDNLK